MDTPEKPAQPAAPDAIDANSDGRKTEASEGGQDAAGGDRAARFSERIQTLRLEKQPVNLSRPRRRWWLLLLVVLAIAAGGLYAYWSGALSDFLPGPMEVDSFTVTPQELSRVVLSTTGTVVAPKTVEIIPQVAGKVEKLGPKFDVGRQVKEGDLLVQIEGGQYEAGLNQAKAARDAAKFKLDEAQAGARHEDVEQAQAALDQAKARRDLLAKEIERTKRLGSAISEAEREQVEANFREAEANVVRLKAALQLVKLGPRKEQKAALEAEVARAKALVSEAEFFFNCTRIHSPIGGIVLERSVELGEVISLQPGLSARSIAKIADLSELEVEIEIQERYLNDIQEPKSAKIKPGLSCTIKPTAYPDAKCVGRLVRLSPVLSRERGSRQAYIKLENFDIRLAANMGCNVEIREELPKDQEGVFLVPEEAIVEKENEKPSLFVYRDGKACSQDVTLGEARDGKVEVLDGLEKDDEVLLPGDKKLKDKQPIRIRSKNKK